MTLTCQVEGATGAETYLWTSTCTTGCFINHQIDRMTVARSTLQSVDSGNHTCTATCGGLTGSDTIEMNVVGKCTNIHGIIIYDSLGVSAVALKVLKDQLMPMFQTLASNMISMLDC